MLKNLSIAIVLSIFMVWLRNPQFIFRLFSNMAREIQPYSMAFVTAPNKDVAKTLAGGLGKTFLKQD